MQLDSARLAAYLADIAEQLERYGVVLDLTPDDDLVIVESPGGARAFGLRGFLSDGRQPARSVLEVREVWQPTAEGAYERFGYEYELLDHDRGYRRAFHRHDSEVFVRRYELLVHEHCERPVGSATCNHYAGLPVRDAFAAVEKLVGTWIDPQPPECEALVCLDDRRT